MYLGRLPAIIGITTGLVSLQLAPLAVADQVFLDDVIVDGSLCVGFDCVNGESFGFDTLRLKENNLRIKFLDTSTSASFPSNDWQLTANETSNGGQNKFSIDDISGGRTPFTVEAGAPSHSLYVDDGGRIGLGTSTPVVEVHIVDGDTPTLRLEQDGSSGFTPQTWDVAGNETNFFVRDASNGSKLPFRIRPDANTNSIYVDAGGNGVIFGGTSFGADNATSIKYNATNGAPDMHIRSAATADAIIGLGDSPDFASGNADALILGWNGSSDQAFIGTRPGTGHDAPIAFAVQNLVEMTLTTTGLEVADGITVGGTPLTVPDYVFRDDYQLMPIDELAEFVEKNQHLPGVPPEQQIKSEGLNLGGFQMRLLEKIEELVIYTLDQQETIDALTARLAALETQSD